MSVAVDLLREAAMSLASNGLGDDLVRLMRAEANRLERLEQASSKALGDRRALRTNAEVAAGIAKGDRRSE